MCRGERAVLPINAGPRHPGSDAAGREPVFFKDGCVPWFEACGSEEDFAAGFQGAVESLHLGCGLGFLGVEPVHAIHDLLFQGRSSQH